MAGPSKVTLLLEPDLAEVRARSLDSETQLVILGHVLLAWPFRALLGQVTNVKSHTVASLSRQVRKEKWTLQGETCQDVGLFKKRKGVLS